MQIILSTEEKKELSLNRTLIGKRGKDKTREKKRKRRTKEELGKTRLLSMEELKKKENESFFSSLVVFTEEDRTRLNRLREKKKECKKNRVYYKEEDLCIIFCIEEKEKIDSNSSISSNSISSLHSIRLNYRRSIIRKIEERLRYNRSRLLYLTGDKRRNVKKDNKRLEEKKEEFLCMEDYRLSEFISYYR